MAIKQRPDSPTNNFATLNSLEDTNVSYSNGSLTHTQNTWISGESQDSKSTMSVPVGKFYWEALYNSTSKDNPGWGVLNAASTNLIGTNSAAYMGDIVSYWPNNINANNYYKNGSTLGVTGSNFTVGDIAMCCVEMFTDGTGKIWFGSNGNWFNGGTPNNSSNEITTLFGTLFPAFDSPGGENCIWIANFGQDPTFGGNKTPSNGTNSDGSYPDKSTTGIGGFFHEPPTDALALCTANLPDFTSDVDDDTPQDYFKAVKYTGQTTIDAGTWDIGNNILSVAVGFQADLVWLKGRSYAEHHHLYDVVRGATKVLYSNRTVNEQTDTLGLTSFDADGFSIGSRHEINNSGDTFVAWCWKAGGAPSGSTSTTGSAKRINTSDTQDDTSCSALATAATNAGASNVITPTLMSINQAAGFSIVKYTGTGANATVPHGLSSAPEMIIGKSIDGSRSWNVYHVATGNTGILQLDATNEFYANSVYWQNTSPTSTVFSIGTQSEMNSAENIIAYCWHSVEGYSKFGSYTGNGSADGPFIYTGFKPALVICKTYTYATTTHTSWAMYDNARDSSNVMNKVLYANQSINEGYRGNASTAETGIYIDFLSNGFKIRSNHTEHNSDQDSILYACFAEQPFNYANAR